MRYQLYVPVLLLFLAMVSIQFGASVAKNLFPIAGVAGASTLRLVAAAIILAVVFRPWKVSFSKQDRKNLFLYGGSLGLMNLAFYFSLERTPLGVAVALEFVGPLAVAIYNGTRKLDYLWALLAGIGIFLLGPFVGDSQNLDVWGCVLALIAGLFWALYIVFGKRLSNLSSPIAASSGMIIAAIVVAPWGLFLNFSDMMSSKALPLGIFVGLFSSAIPYSLEMSALKKMPSQTFSVLMSLEPAIASLIGLIFLSEALSFSQWAAIVCVVVASQGSSMTPKRPFTGV